MSKTFLLVKPTPTPEDAAWAKRMWMTWRLPWRWTLRLWLRIHGWRIEPLVKFRVDDKATEVLESYEALLRGPVQEDDD